MQALQYPDRVPASFVRTKVRTRADFYEAFIRNQYNAPVDRFCTRKWMIQVLEQKAYCPKMSAKYRKIFSQPSAKYLRVEVMQYLLDICNRVLRLNPDSPEDLRQLAIQYLATCRRIRHHNPGADWLVTVLWNVYPEHQIFRKSYVAPKRERIVNPRFEPMFDAYDGFFEDLPDLDPERMKARAMGVPAMQKLQQKFEHEKLAFMRKMKSLEKMRGILRRDGDIVVDYPGMEAAAQIRHMEDPMSGLELALHHIDRLIRKFNNIQEVQLSDDEGEDSEHELFEQPNGEVGIRRVVRDLEVEGNHQQPHQPEQQAHDFNHQQEEDEHHEDDNRIDQDFGRTAIANTANLSVSHVFNPPQQLYYHQVHQQQPMQFPMQQPTQQSFGAMQTPSALHRQAPLNFNPSMEPSHQPVNVNADFTHVTVDTSVRRMFNQMELNHHTDPVNQQMNNDAAINDNVHVANGPSMQYQGVSTFDERSDLTNERPTIVHHESPTPPANNNQNITMAVDATNISNSSARRNIDLTLPPSREEEEEKSQRSSRRKRGRHDPIEGVSVERPQYELPITAIAKAVKAKQDRNRRLKEETETQPSLNPSKKLPRDHF